MKAVGAAPFLRSRFHHSRGSQASSTHQADAPGRYWLRFRASSTSTATIWNAAASTRPSRSRASLKSPNSRSTGSGSPSVRASSSSARARANVDRRRCIAAASSGLDDEPIADPTDRFNPIRLAHLTPDLVDRLLHAVLKTSVGGAPNLVQQLRTSYHLAGAIREQLQHQQGTALELQDAIAEPSLASCRIEVQTSP